MNLTESLFNNQDLKYKQFSRKLTPDTKLPIIGVRVPELRKIAKNAVLYEDYASFLNEKHTYFEEVYLHGLLIVYGKFDYGEKIKLVSQFLPLIDNWAICDGIAASIKFSENDKKSYFEFLLALLNSNNAYTVRFAIVSFLTGFIPEFDAEIVSAVKGLISGDYYVNMALSWLYCELLIKDYNNTLPIIEEKSLPKFVQNTTIKKSCESFRISESQKERLKTFKIK